jgi:hypothetical protein
MNDTTKPAEVKRDVSFGADVLARAWPACTSLGSDASDSAERRVRAPDCPSMTLDCPVCGWLEVTERPGCPVCDSTGVIG